MDELRTAEVSPEQPERLYIGDSADGHAKVWVAHRPPTPHLAEVGEVIRDLRRLSGTPGIPRHEREAVLDRKRDVIRRIEAAEHAPAPQRLEPPVGGEFDWTGSGAPTTALAGAILRHEMGLEPTREACEAFASDVLIRLPRWSFELPATEVQEWAAARPDIKWRSPSAGPALSVIDEETSAELDGRPAEVLTESSASDLVAACETAWSSIQANHPGVPDTVIVLGTGVERGRLVKLGHWWDAQWKVGDAARGEVLLAGEALHLPPDCVFEILLHEAAHGLNAARGIKDTSRGGRYHNANFKAAAAELGLRPRRMDPYGWARTELTEATRTRYAEAIEQISEHMVLARGLAIRPVAGAERQGGGEPTGPEDRDRDGDRQGPKNPAAECGCGRKMRMAKSVLAQGPVLCGVCGSEFATPIGAEHTPRGLAAQGVVDRTFTARRSETVATEEPRPDHLADGLRRLHEIEAAINAITADGDPESLRMKEVFAERKGEIVAWFEELVTADVIELHVPDRATSADLSSATERSPRPDTPSPIDAPRELELPVPELDL